MRSKIFLLSEPNRQSLLSVRVFYRVEFNVISVIF